MVLTTINRKDQDSQDREALSLTNQPPEQTVSARSIQQLPIWTATVVGSAPLATAFGDGTELLPALTDHQPTLLDGFATHHDAGVFALSSVVEKRTSTVGADALSPAEDAVAMFCRLKMAEGHAREEDTARRSGENLPQDSWCQAAARNSSAFYCDYS